VLSYEFWQHHFAGDPKVLGRSIFVDTFSGPVVAVLNPGFDLSGRGLLRFSLNTPGRALPLSARA
jgi:hypothetical protein